MLLWSGSCSLSREFEKLKIICHLEWSSNPKWNGNIANNKLEDEDFNIRKYLDQPKMKDEQVDSGECKAILRPR